MQFNTSPNEPSAKAEVNPYFSSRRPYDVPYLLPQYIPPAPPRAPALAQSGPPRRSSTPGDDGMQTVEHVITNGYFATPDGDPATALIGDKKRTTWLGLDDAIGQLRLRYEIYERNLYDITRAECAATNALHEWHAERGWPSDKQLDNLQKTLQGLYSQRRDERLSLWKDSSRLRQTLPEWVQQYLSAVRKVDLLDDGRGDGP